MLSDIQKAIRMVGMGVIILSSYALIRAWLVDEDQRLTIVNGVALFLNLIIVGGLWEFKNWARIWLLIRFAFSGFMLARVPTPSNLAMILFFLMAGYYLCRRDVVAAFERTP